MLIAAKDDPQGTLAFVESRTTAAAYAYAVLVTSTDYELRAAAQLYRERADAENNFDELENQWGWGGFTTHDLKHCCLVASMVALIYNWWNINKAYYMCEGIVPNTIFILSKNGIYINQYENNYDLAKVYLLGDNKIDDEVIKSIFVYKNVLYCICKGKIFYGLSQRELMNNAPINWELASYIAGRDISDENVINVAVKGEMLDIETKKYHLRYSNKSWNKIDIKGRYIPISENRYLILRKEKLYDYRHEDVIVYDKVLDAAYNFETKDILIITPYDVIKILPSNEIVTGKGNRLFNLHNKIFLLSNEECESL